MLRCSRAPASQGVSHSLGAVFLLPAPVRRRRVEARSGGVSLLGCQQQRPAGQHGIAQEKRSNCILRERPGELLVPSQL